VLTAAIASVAALSIPVASALATGPNLSVTAASLTDPTTGQQLYGFNPNAKEAIASTTKLMTALITLQHVGNLNTIFTQMNFRPQPADSQIGLVPGQKMSAYDLLIALLLPSADDAAMDLAYNVGHHSVRRFVKMMNAEAVALHLTRTHYANPIGLDQAGNYSSAYDLTRLAAYDMAHYPIFRRIIDWPSATIPDVGEVFNTDGLIGEVRWINGVKTGHTADAGYVLVSSGTQHRMRLIGAVLGTSSEAARDQNGLALLEWGFANFKHVQPVIGGSVMARPTVNGSSSHAELIAANGFQKDLPKRDRVSVKLQHVPSNLQGPLPARAVEGFALVRVNGVVVARIPLLLHRAVPAESPLTAAARFVGRPSTLIVLLLLATAGGAVAITRRRQPRPRTRSRTARTAL
jgi:D-alanyl-D-alanine carboxypeptidase (penicillin-binding protein 5/6)